MLQNRGLSKFDKRRNNSFNYRKDLNNKKGISSNGVTELYVDRSGIIWIGTMDGGINKIDPYKKQFLHYEHNLSNQNSLSENKVWSIYEDSYGKVWIATAGKGVDVLVPESNQFINYTRNTNEPLMKEESTGIPKILIEAALSSPYTFLKMESKVYLTK